MRTNLLQFDRAGLAAHLAALGEPAFRATQLIRWIHRGGSDDFEMMTDVSRNLRRRLHGESCITAPRILRRQDSADGTCKWLMGLADGGAVETVFIPAARRGTLCVSSQLGCPLACTFCATGAGGYRRNLSTAEIIGQLWRVRRQLEPAHDGRRVISNVVFMGMGEPLLNLEQVLPAVHLMLDTHAYGLSRRRVTVSTAGLVPGMERLREAGGVALAVSLHAATDALRDRLVPLNRSYPLAELMAACRRYVDHAGVDTVTFEYTLLQGVNDSPADAGALVTLLRPLPCKINLIPFNPFPGTRYRRSSPQAMQTFRQILLDAGYIATLRSTRGDDVQGACGQLTGDFLARASTARRQAAFNATAPC